MKTPFSEEFVFAEIGKEIQHRVLCVEVDMMKVVF